jgi:hypothetical protein
MHAVVEPAFRVDAVDGKNLYLSGIDVGSEGIDELESFVFEVVCGGCREEKQCESVVAIHHDFHIFI